MVRGAIFNSLQGLVDVDGAAVGDLFAGTGAMGIEALSRGASRCTFVESAPSAVDVIKKNLHTTSFLDAATVVGADAVAWLARHPTARFDLVFADPPYAFDAWDAVGGVDAGVLVAESDRDVDLGEAWRVLRTKQYGSTVVTLFVSRNSPRSPS
jgi:16S rRNA (guanine966-N2)-methyltransferase